VILAKLRGGLSNQMFQYSAARRLAHRRGAELRLDASWYAKIPRGATPRAFELHHFNICAAMATPWDIIGTDGVRETPPRHLPVAIWRKLRGRPRFVAERQFNFNPAILDLPDDVCLFGYWVSEKYFLDIAPIIRQELTVWEPISTENARILQRMKETASVSLHIRRGDYAHDPRVNRIHGTCSPEYYAAAVAYVAARVPDPRIFVFSDDLEWARENMNLRYPTEYISHNQGLSSHEDLRLMSSCRHHIIANSGFSWWGAWLDPRPDKIVCAPRRWFAEASYDTRDVLPEPWVAL